MHESETSAALNRDQKTAFYPRGTLLHITQQVAHRTDTDLVSVTGRVLRNERQSSGSWFAGNPDDRLWLDRLTLRKADGEITILNLDEYSVVEVLEGAPTAAQAPLVEPAEDIEAGIT